MPDLALRLRELSALRYGVDPVLSAAAIAAFARRYPADVPQPRRLARTAPPSSDTAAIARANADQIQAASAETDASAPTPASDWLAPPPRIKLE